MNNDVYRCLDRIAAINSSDRILSLWVHSKEIFFNRYFVINDENMLIVADKETYKTYEYNKIQDKFKIKFEKQEKDQEQNKTIFKFKNLELIKKSC